MKYIVFTLLFVLIISANKKEKEIYNLKKIVSKTLEHNFDIKITEFRTQESEEKFNQSLGEFDWGISLNLTNNIQNTPVTSTLDTQGNASSVITKTNTQSITISKKLETGTNISIPYTYNIVDSDSTYRTFRETHEPSFGITINQPLLRTFVSDYYSKDKATSNLDFLATSSNEKEDIQKFVYNAIKKIFQYKEGEKNLELFENGLETAQKNLDFIKKKNKLGIASKIEVLESETNFYKSKERFMNQKLKQQQVYNEILIDLGEELKSQISFTNIEDEINHDKIILNKKIFFKNAIDRRGDYLSQKYKLDSQSLKERIASIEYLPKIDLKGTYTSRAVSNSLENANKDLNKGKFVSTNLGLSINYNLLQRSENASEQLNRIKLQKENLKIQQMLNDIGLEVEMAIDNYVTQKQIVESFQKSVEMENTKWKFYQEQFKNGKISSFELAKFQEVKEQAYIKFYQAKYKFAQYYFNLFKVQGNLLETVL